MATKFDAQTSETSRDAAQLLQQHQQKSLLRFITCGSVDDGKSTLLGRLLLDSSLIFDDQLTALKADSKRHGTQGQEIDLALLVDGLAAEREQGITIDVAYRYFATDRRKFIVADCPGHEQYTRNMVTGASTAELAIILLDARQGVLPQTRRHSFLAHLLGIRKFVLAVNKMDLIGFDQDRFEGLVSDYRACAEQIGIEEFVAIPVSGLRGDNVTAPSERMSWYVGPTLLQHLEQVVLDEQMLSRASFHMPVQLVNRPNHTFRGYSGMIASGLVSPGDPVQVQPSGRTSRVISIVTMGGQLNKAIEGQSITLTLADEIDCSRGDVISAADEPLEVADQFEATLVWLEGTGAMLPGRSYIMKIGAASATASVTDIKYAVNTTTLDHIPAKSLEPDAIGVVNLAVDRPLAFAPFADNRELGAFILIDRLSNATVAAGMIHFALRRSHNLHWQHLEVDREAHAALKGQKPKVLWFTGLSGAGKSTIANLVEKKLHQMGRHTFLLDGDNIRQGLNKDLGFTDADRVENIRRIGEVAKLMSDAGLIVLCAFISPFRAERRMVRKILPPGEFVEIFIDTPLPEAEKRDPKGLYAKARRGELPNFTGIDSPYEAPHKPEMRIDTTIMSAEEAADYIIQRLTG